MGEKAGNMFSVVEKRAGGKQYRPDWARLESLGWQNEESDPQPEGSEKPPTVLEQGKDTVKEGFK